MTEEELIESAKARGYRAQIEGYQQQRVYVEKGDLKEGKAIDELIVDAVHGYEQETGHPYVPRPKPDSSLSTGSHLSQTGD